VELPQAIRMYQQALAHDPHFALAAAALSVSEMNLYWQGPDRTKTRLAVAKAAVDQALALQPNLGLGQYAMALYYYYGHRDYATALRWNELARRSMPNNTDVEAFSAFIARRQGQWAKAIAVLHQVALHDPRSAIWYDQLAITYAFLRRYADADAAFAQALMVAQDPDDELVTRAYIKVFWQGNLSPLRIALDGLTPGTDAYNSNAQRFYWFDWWSRDFRAAITKATTDVAAGWFDNSSVGLPRQLFLAWAYTAAGDRTNAEQNYTAVQASMRTRLIQQPGDAELHLALGFADGGLGLKSEAVREGRKAAKLMPIGRDAYTGAAILGYLAELYVRVGDNRHAIDLLRQLLAMPAGLSVSPALLTLDPVWDPVRNDPRFQALLKKYENTDQNSETGGG
ncbi:MAG: winged helix-turn-helix domain-containing protein, partial [Gammaproteobacteria bacterium]